MTKTENLELNIIEGTDVPAYAPYNENMNKLDSNIKRINDDITSLKSSSELTSSKLTTIDEEQRNQNILITKNTKDIEVLKDNVKVKIQVNDTIKTGTLYTVKLNRTASFNGIHSIIPIYDYDNNTIKTDERYYVGIMSANITIDLTTMFNITNVEDIELISCIAYAKGYYNYTSNVNPVPLVARTVSAMTPSGDNKIRLVLEGNNTRMIKQTLSSGSWLPSTFTTSQDGESTIILRFIKYDKE